MPSERRVQMACPFDGSVINVMEKGAQGDGTNDTAVLRKAIDESEEGDAIYFPPGIYVVSGSLSPKAHQVFFSLTDKAIIKAVAAEDLYAVFEVALGPVEFRHLVLDLAETRPPTEKEEALPGILAHAVGAVVDLVVASCKVRGGFGHGIQVHGGAQSGRDRVIVRETLVQDCYESGLSLGSVHGARVEASRFEHCRNGFVAASSRDVVVHAVTATRNRRHGIVFRFSHDWHVDNCVAKGNGGMETDRDKLRGWGIAAGGGPEEGTPNSDFTITNNICEDNYAGGITLDPTSAEDPTIVWAQRARVSGNVCRGRKNGEPIGTEELYAYGTHGIHVRNSEHVVVTDNLCHENMRSGIAVVNSAHVLVQANASYENTNGIGLFSDLENAGHHVIGVNMLYDNCERDLLQGDFGVPLRALPGLRLYGLHGSEKPTCSLRANPGTLFEWHDDREGEGALYVKRRGSGDTGWARVTAVSSWWADLLCWLRRRRRLTKS
jgi:parallel beta-helix repeat protein